MPSTFLSLHYHVIFSTKDRVPLISRDWQPRLHEYLSGTLRGLGGFPEGVGGVADHVHLLLGLKSTHRLADVVRELKKSASTWVHREMEVPTFSWQDGYAAFSVSPSARQAVQNYIARQEEHHRRQSFREELTELLSKAKLDYDPKYLT